MLCIFLTFEGIFCSNFGRRLAKKTIVFVKKLKRLLLAIPPKVRSRNAAHTSASLAIIFKNRLCLLNQFPCAFFVVHFF